MTPGPAVHAYVCLARWFGSNLLAARTLISALSWSDCLTKTRVVETVCQNIGLRGSFVIMLCMHGYFERDRYWNGDMLNLCSVFLIKHDLVILSRHD